jgi:tetratricopeptide (TPR) repeat protein
MMSEDKKRRDAPSDLSESGVTASHSIESLEPRNSLTGAMFLYWVVPVLLFAVFSRLTVDTNVGTVKTKPLKSIPIQLDQDYIDSTPSVRPTQAPIPVRQADNPSLPSRWPTSYRATIEKIERRRPHWKNKPTLSPSAQPSAADSKRLEDTVTSSPLPNGRNAGGRPRGRASDPNRLMIIEKIDAMRQDVVDDPADIYKAIEFADALRFYDLQYREGGTYETEAIDTYNKVVHLVVAKRNSLVAANQPTNISLNGSGTKSVSDEVTLDYASKSADGLVCAVYTALGKVYYMANMFERAAKSYTECLEIAPSYLDAVNARASTNIILGKYAEAGADFLKVVREDEPRLFPDSFSGIARVLEAQEDAIPGGWGPVVEVLDQLIPSFEAQWASAPPQTKQIFGNGLNRFHHSLFTYHDKKTKAYSEAWHHLTEAYQYKMANLPVWQSGQESTKSFQTKQIFKPGFWSPGVGSETETPIFIIGFVRSGSTLLERILDAHPKIVGTGENSVFNGRLDDIRNKIVQVSMGGRREQLGEVTRRLAEEVVDGMRKRWRILQATTETSGVGDDIPLRFVDKMLTNYYNVGFIHLLYPKALILHVYRNPMDTIFSAYKHEFPSGTLDYTSDFDALAELYHSYRDIIDHWDDSLPGRVTHVRYEDMVQDMPGMARAIIDATGLPWDDSVLQFHKQKHAVNTLSTTQVRKGIYKDSLKSWAKYENELQPMVQLIGGRVHFNIKATLQPVPTKEEL